ncbi:uncharacterized protein LOC124123847 [Haliotis rufescens]|uniref:uncharacterized protein LOC124123847 n=1 Tax=Haliotis rufescens TaxID=6454 RepID=UPI001EB03FF5|nr:uncharacterized protein LOC124123847 [Haliotis rufescens]
MGFSEASVLSKVGLGLAGAALLFDVIGFATDSWMTGSLNSGFIGSIDLSMGLFKRCAAAVCVSMDTDEDWLKGTKALVILGFLLGLGSLAVIIVYLFFKTDQMLFKTVGLALSFAAAGFTIIGIIVFAAKGTEEYKTMNLSWSFALTIIGGLLYCATGIVLLLG